jgi:hypothetical protein
MNENGREPVEPTLRELVERYREQKEKGGELVEAMFREALEREREQKQRERAAVEQVFRQALEKAQPLPPAEAPTIHYAELPAAPPDSQLYQEWEFYRREVGRLLAEGEEGRFVLIKAEKVVGIWDTQEEAEAVAFYKYPLEPCLIHQVQRRERLLRGPSRVWRCLG